MRERAERVQVLEIPESEALVEERRQARRRNLRDVVVGLAVTVAVLAFGIYCVLLDSPWRPGQ